MLYFTLNSRESRWIAPFCIERYTSTENKCEFLPFCKYKYFSGRSCAYAFKTVNHVTSGQSWRLFWSGLAVLYSHTWLGNSHSSVCGSIIWFYTDTERLHMISLHRKKLLYKTSYNRGFFSSHLMQWKKQLCNERKCTRVFVSDVSTSV